MTDGGRRGGGGRFAFYSYVAGEFVSVSDVHGGIMVEDDDDFDGKNCRHLRRQVCLYVRVKSYRYTHTHTSLRRIAVTASSTIHTYINRGGSCVRSVVLYYIHVYGPLGTRMSRIYVIYI